MRSSFFLLAVSLVASLPLNARTRVSICNIGNTDLKVATIQEKHGWIRGSVESYYSSGWFTINPVDESDCAAGFFSSSKAEEVFSDNFDSVILAFAYKDSRGQFGAFIPSDSTKSLYCVKRARFEFEVSSKEELKSCHTSAGFLFPYTWRVAGGDVVIKVDPDRNVPVSEGRDPNQNLAPSTQDQDGAPNVITHREAAPAKHEKTAAELHAEAHAEALQDVRNDVNAYIAAAVNGFESYKTGEPHTVGQDRVWKSREAPYFGLASCSVAEKLSPEKKNVFSCELFSDKNKAIIQDRYAELVDEVAAVLPKGWTVREAPFEGSAVASKGFYSNTGIRGQIWIQFNTDNGEYSLKFQVVAPRN